MRPTKSSHSFEVKGQEVKFSSNFDSGNLRTVTQIGVFEFLVESSQDTYEIPASNKSFFHFKVDNYPINEPIRLIIKNLSLLECIKHQRRTYYKPCFSYNGLDYDRVPENSSTIKQNEDGLDLEINMFMVKPTVYFSFALPYSYERYLNMIRDLPESNQEFYIKKQVLCYTKNLHLVYMITITSYDRRTNQYDQIGSSTNGVILPEKHLEESRIYFDKPVILLSARVHPGQTPSSWAIEGIIKFLIQNSEQAKLLRKKFQIVIVPMLNPDGVYEGMYRLDTQGHNLNRYYLISDNRQPSIYSMKHLIKHYNSTKRLLFYFDFHGHPSFKGSFLYGNAIDDIAYQAETELFGRIMSIKCDTFQEKYCIFDRQQMSSKDRYDMYTKEGCARVYAFKTANILHSYTVQMGFHGCTNFTEESQKNVSTFYYKTDDYYNEGISILRSVLQVSGLANSNIDRKTLRKQIAIEILVRQQRFKKQDRNVSKKKKNVNEIIQNQYWAPIKLRFFNLIDEGCIPKIRKVNKKKIISRTSFISSTVVRSGEETQPPVMVEKKAYKQKLNTEIFDTVEDNIVTKNYLENKRKKLQMRHMIFSTNKGKDSSLSKKDEGQSIKKIQIQRKSSIDRTSQKPKRNQIKILSGRSKCIDLTHTATSIKPTVEHFEQFMFNDLNLRKGTTQFTSNSIPKNDFCIISAEKITSRVDQLKQMFKPDKLKQLHKVKYKNSLKKYSSFFG